jgi:hypothetical protein
MTGWLCGWNYSNMSKKIIMFNTKRIKYNTFLLFGVEFVWLQELLTVPEYLEIIHVLELGSRRHTTPWLKDKIHIMDSSLFLLAILLFVVFRFRVSDYPFVTFLFLLFCLTLSSNSSVSCCNINFRP